MQDQTQLRMSLQQPKIQNRRGRSSKDLLIPTVKMSHCDNEKVFRKGINVKNKNLTSCRCSSCKTVTRDKCSSVTV